MENKEIYIDGVDVSGCPHYIHKDGSCSSHDCECVKCVHNVCFYKDYKAKEQECEELKKQLMQKSEVDMFFNTPIECWSSDPCGVCKYKNCLTEIKEIAEHCIKQDICTTCDNSDKCHIEDEEIPTYDVCKLILQKISECEVEND